MEMAVLADSSVSNAAPTLRRQAYSSVPKKYVRRVSATERDVQSILHNPLLALLTSQRHLALYLASDTHRRLRRVDIVR
jgi:hypothetical protein